MKPGLRGFFDSMTEFFTTPGPDALERLYAAHPGWDAPRSRVELYGRMVRHHGRATLEKLYPLTRASVDEAGWVELARAYEASRPSRPFEMNHLGEGFPGFLADEAERRGLPDFLPALARFEWADFAVYTSMEPVPEKVERLTVNPTLVALEHPFQLCAYVRAKGRGRPEPGQEMALLWRHPERLVTMYLAASDRSLLALKMAVEGLTPAQVAAATGVAEADIRAAVEACVSDGLVLSP
ncbi:putative DNA-binding domain-containing protein [Archangium violaceum]|uniref:HvfC/BufC N-terminal domain-containing protein n=1 Tax=Archangium violaceum TaxID=83451 RepID=UPI00193C77DD|nr:putative DNA-binding domain-containing protein [Archangium violaceum]QRK05118.1 putative DNA-binding domain-containing protein [Archangium violaceum]